MSWSIVSNLWPLILKRHFLPPTAVASLLTIQPYDPSIKWIGIRYIKHWSQKWAHQNSKYSLVGCLHLALARGLKVSKFFTFLTFHHFQNNAFSWSAYIECRRKFCSEPFAWYLYLPLAISNMVCQALTSVWIFCRYQYYGWVIRTVFVHQHQGKYHSWENRFISWSVNPNLWLLNLRDTFYHLQLWPMW